MYKESGSGLYSWLVWYELILSLHHYQCLNMRINNEGSFEEEECVPWDVESWWLSLECGWAGLMHHLPRISHANTGIHWRTHKYPRYSFCLEDTAIGWALALYFPSTNIHQGNIYCSCSQRCESNSCVVLFFSVRPNKANKPYIRTVSTLMVRGS